MKLRGLLARFLLKAKEDKRFPCLRGIIKKKNQFEFKNTYIKYELSRNKFTTR